MRARGDLVDEVRRLNERVRKLEIGIPRANVRIRWYEIGLEGDGHALNSWNDPEWDVGVLSTVCFMRGGVETRTDADDADTPIARVPLVARPTARRQVPVLTEDGVACWLVIDPNGYVNLNVTSGSRALERVICDGVTYPLLGPAGGIDS